MSLIKSSEDIRVLRSAGQLLGDTLRFATELAVPGATLASIDRAIHDRITAATATPSFLGYDGFPNASCLSLNAEVVHGIPNARLLKEGDILGIDVGLWLDRRCVDAAITVPVGKIDPDAARLLAVTQEALAAGIAAIRPGRKVGAISSAVQQVAEDAGMGIVRALTGHGVGHKVHEDPEVPNVGRSSDGILLRPGMVLAIEPMLTLGSGSVYTDVDGWTVVTADSSLAAQFEHTVVVTRQGAEILTNPQVMRAA
jgi:methionyl aminopeptidase